MSSTVLITGSNRGLGLEFVKQYAHDEWTVFACCRNPDQAQELQQVAQNFPQKVFLHQLDTSNFDQIENLAQTIESPLDVLLHNAGVYGSQSNQFGQVDYMSWADVFRVNTMAALKMAESFVNQVERSAQKKMVFITSKMGSIADNGYGSSYLYRSSKAALNAVVKSLSIDLRDQKITANVIHPGWVQTDMGGPNAKISAEQSIAEMRQVIGAISAETTGQFFNYDGSAIPW